MGPNEKKDYIKMADMPFFESSVSESSDYD